MPVLTGRTTASFIGIERASTLVKGKTSENDKDDVPSELQVLLGSTDICPTDDPADRFSIAVSDNLLSCTTKHRIKTLLFRFLDKTNAMGPFLESIFKIKDDFDANIEQLKWVHRKETGSNLTDEQIVIITTTASVESSNMFDPILKMTGKLGNIVCYLGIDTKTIGIEPVRFLFDDIFQNRLLRIGLNFRHDLENLGMAESSYYDVCGYFATLLSLKNYAHHCKFTLKEGESTGRHRGKPSKTYWIAFCPRDDVISAALGCLRTEVGAEIECTVRAAESIIRVVNAYFVATIKEEGSKALSADVLKFDENFQGVLEAKIAETAENYIEFIKHSEKYLTFKGVAEKFERQIEESEVGSIEEGKELEILRRKLKATKLESQKVYSDNSLNQVVMNPQLYSLVSNKLLLRMMLDPTFWYLVTIFRSYHILGDSDMPRAELTPGLTLSFAKMVNHEEIRDKSGLLLRPECYEAVTDYTKPVLLKRAVPLIPSRAMSQKIGSMMSLADPSRPVSDFSSSYNMQDLERGFIGIFSQIYSYRKHLHEMTMALDTFRSLLTRDTIMEEWLRGISTRSPKKEHVFDSKRIEILQKFYESFYPHSVLFDAYTKCIRNEPAEEDRKCITAG